MSDFAMSRLSRAAAALSTAFAVAILLLVAIAAPASADFEFESAGFELSDPPVLDTNGTPEDRSDDTLLKPSFQRQAGSHPDFVTNFTVAQDETGFPLEAVRDIDVDLPPGMVGNPTGLATCSAAKLTNESLGGADCPVESQIGLVEPVAWGYGGPGPSRVGLFNMAHGPDVPALFGFNYANVIGLVTPRVNPDDFSISSASLAISATLTIESVRVTIWGVPADPSHDVLRQDHKQNLGVGEAGTPSNDYFIKGLISAHAPRVPFLTAPTSCTEQPVAFSIRGDSWEAPGKFDERTVTADEDGVPFAFEGCERLTMDPSVEVRPLARTADSPTGLSVDIDVPQLEDPDGLATPHVRKVKTILPEGMTVSASSASGLGSCSPGQIGIGSNAAPTCPESSKLGTVAIETPLVDETLEGDVFLAKQNDNPFNSLLAMYMAVKGPGFYLKLPGKIEADPTTGRLTTTFSETPQLPFEHLRLELAGGPRAALTTPQKCGTYTVQTEITSWASPVPLQRNASFQITEGCNTGGFAPGLQAGTVNPTAGSYSPFVLRITRSDGEENLAALTATLPKGLLAKLKGVPLCGDAQAATGECPASSQVGTAMVGAGSGPNPLYVPEAGKAPTAAYLSGPYKGAPYSLVVKVPAQAGPFDLGTVAVRNALNIDPATAQVTAVSEPLPQILQGIPIAYRDVRVEINRPDFTINPTNCDPKQVTSVLTSSGGKTATPADRFRVVGCGELGFGPKLALKFTGPTHRSAHPALKATLTVPKGGANIGKAVVTLPKTEFLENAHIRTICTRVQYAADQCPKGSVYGYAKAWTPLLDKPLQGPVYLRSSSHTLPDLVASLDGAIHVDLAGRIDSPGGKIRNTFWAVPDAPVSKFVLTMQGGDKGLLVNNEELCKAKPRALAEFTGQNGKRSVTKPLVKVGCGGGKKR